MAKRKFCVINSYPRNPQIMPMENLPTIIFCSILQIFFFGNEWLMGAGLKKFQT